MARRRHIIAYDIREPKRLRLVCKVMEEYGERLQYSVFVCDLSRTELIHCRSAVEEVMKLDVDSVVIIDLGDPREGRFTFIGTSRGLPSSGARII